MKNKEIHDYCFGCPLPRLMQSLEVNRNGAKMANAYIVSSESPTQASVYQSEAVTDTTNLREAMKDVHKFVSLGKKCQSCNF